MTEYERDPNDLDADRIYDELVLQPLIRQIDEEKMRLAHLAEAATPTVYIEQPEGWVANSFSVRRDPEYDDSYLPREHNFLDDYDPEHSERFAWPVRFIAGINPTDIEDLQLDPNTIWQIPAKFDIFDISLETIEIATGFSLIQLCDRQLPAEGTE